MATTAAMVGVMTVAAVALDPAPQRPPGEVQKRWTTEDGLPQNTVASALQTHDGYLWLGTLGGLARFDGVRFTVFDISNTEGLGSNRILSLLEDRRGTLWIGTDGAGVTRYSEGRFEHLAPGQDAPEGQVWAMIEDGEGAVWVGGSSLMRFADGEHEEWPDVPGGEGAAIRTLLVDRTGVLWVGSNRGITRRFDGEFERVDGRQVWTLCEHHDGTLWAYGFERHAVWDGERFIDAPASVFDGQPVWDTLIDSAGDLWLASETGMFVTRAGSDTVEALTLQALPRDSRNTVGVRSVVEDREGNLWLGTNGEGLIRSRSAPFVILGPSMGLPPSPPWTVAPDRAGGILLVTGKGDFLHVDEAGVRPAIEGPMPRNGVLVDRNGTTWLLADAKSRLVRSDDRGQVEIDHGLDRPLTTLFEDSSGTLWVGSEGALLRVRGGETEMLTLPEVAGSVSAIREGPDGALWVLAGLSPVLIRLLDGTTRIWTRDDGLPRGAPRDLHVDAAGTAWVTTYGSGLVRVDGDRVAVLTTAQGLPDPSLGGIVEDDRGRLWVNSNRGVFYADREELSACAKGTLARARCFLLHTGEGNGKSACKTADGRLWFPALDGLIVVDPALAEQQTHPPRVVIEEVVANHRPYPPSMPALVPAGTDDLEVRYTALALSSPEQVRFRYRLAGYDDRWIDAGMRRTALFTNVPPGSYRFEVAAANEDLVWNEADAGVDVDFEPWFYQTWTFFALCGLLLASAVLGAHRLRLRRLERHNQALRREIEEREHAQDENRALQARLLEGQKLEAVGRLAGGVAHDFNNILTVVIGRAELLETDRAAAPGVREHAREIRTCGERAAALTSQLLAFSRQQVLRPKVIDPNVILNELEPMLQRLVPENISFEVLAEEAVGSLEVDPHQLEQVVLNLVVNAKDAMPEGGRLLVRTRRLALGPDDVSELDGAPAGAYVEILVSDAGHGIADEDLPHVFEPFFSTKPVGQGTGLGLASVHGIVQQSSGHLLVESRPGEGTTFRVRLPAVDRVPEARAQELSDDAPTEGIETLLICDDERAVLLAAEVTLRRCGYRVLVADRPSEALRLYRAHSGEIDLLVTDVVMPEMDGATLSAEIAARRGSIRTLFVSGYTPHPTIGEKVVQPGNGFLQKPYSMRELALRVRALLDEEPAPAATPAGPSVGPSE